MILTIGAFGLAACDASKAQNQTIKNSSISTMETTAAQTSPTPEKKPKTNKNPIEMSAEDIKNGSVKSDDYEENMQPVNRSKSLCDVRAFVMNQEKTV